jgi:acyl-coenzyme A synthetase/AMP-(fatty) acid ligase
MKPPKSDVDSLLDALRGAAELSGLCVSDRVRRVALADLLQASFLGDRLEELRGRSVLLATRGQLATALALFELDGHARRFVVCPADVGPRQLAAIIADAEIDAVVSDRGLAEFGPHPPGLVVVPSLRATPVARSAASCASEWVLLTSGTTGAPKLVVHSLAGLSAAFARPRRAEPGVVWATFYDIRRYGGLQIFLRAAIGPSSLVLTSEEETVADHLCRLADCGVTHISGTPTHWRRALMSPAARLFAPRYVRLSGEIADQAVLDSLRAFWPAARIGHAYASTEAGVGFEVLDGLEGFPAALLGARGDVEMKVVDGSLRIRSTRTASRYLSPGVAQGLADGEGFVDTGDAVECSPERCYFRGRRGGIINVGGSKVHPEEVEAVINRHPWVRMSLVKGQKSPITSAIVVADVVLHGGAGGPTSAEAAQAKEEVLSLCRRELAPHKVPVLIRIVDKLPVTESGKLARPQS